MANKIVYNGDINDNFCVITFGYDNSAFEIFKVNSKEEGLELHKKHEENSLYSGGWCFNVNDTIKYLEWCKKPLTKQCIDLGFSLQ